jgi:hypothetical protein
MGAGVAWLFPILAVAVSIGLSLLALKINIPNKLLYVVDLALFGAAGWAAVFLTKAGKGAGIGATVVAGLLMAIGSYMIVASVMGAATSELTTAVGSAGGADAEVTRAGAAAAGGVFGAFFGIIAALVNFGIVLVAGITGAIVGGNMKKAVLGSEQPAEQRAAA